MQAAQDIWIVDDDDGILEVTKIIVEQNGLKVRALSTAPELEAALLTAQPRLLLLDILLEGVDGATLAQKIKTNPQTKDIVVILMSADIGVIAKSKKAGVDGFLKKPFDISELEALVKKYTA